MRYLELDTAKRYSVIGLGTWQFGSREWGYGATYDDGEAARIVARARELGVTVFDTAEIYGFGRSERILGAALRASGGTDDVVIASKVFPVLPTAAIVQQRGVASAQRLGVRQIDLYQVHQPNPVVGDRTTMRGMRALRDVGVVDEVGVSNYPLRRWQRSEVELGGRVLTNQVHFNLVAPRPDGRDAALGAAHRARRDGLQPAGAGLPLRAVLRADSARPAGYGRPTPCSCRRTCAPPGRCSGGCARWPPRTTPRPRRWRWPGCVHFPNVVAIPGASSVAQVESNAAAAEIRLTAEEHGALTAAAEAFRPLTGVSALPGLVRGRL